MRREDATATVLTYLAPLGAKTNPRKGGVLRFKASTMPLFPKGDVAYQHAVEWGTLMKLYAYQLKNTGNIIRRDGLLYKLDLLLPDPALPIRMHECRKRAHGVGEKGAAEQSITMSGLFARLHNNPNLEDAPPISTPITIHGRQLIARVFAFKAGRGATYRSNEGVIFTVNGQAHADIKAAIFARKRVDLQRLAKDLLVVVDCSSLDANQRDDLFMSSRDRVAEESPLFTELERNLEDALRDHPGLRELRNRRAQQDLDEQLNDNKPLESVLKRVLKRSPALAKLFAKGERLSTPFKPANVQPNLAPPRHEKPLPLLYIDLDDFKPVNDTLGHKGGDDVLIEVARRLKAAVRSADTVARVGGDEFAILMEPHGDRADAEELAARVLAGPSPSPSASALTNARSGRALESACYRAAPWTKTR